MLLLVTVALNVALCGDSWRIHSIGERKKTKGNDYGISCTSNERRFLRRRTYYCFVDYESVVSFRNLLMIVLLFAATMVCTPVTLQIYSNGTDWYEPQRQPLFKCEIENVICYYAGPYKNFVLNDAITCFPKPPSPAPPKPTKSK